MKSTLLHVGPHKTGTTYLQACFSHFRSELKARGVVVPAAWEHAHGNFSHTGLVAALREGGDMAQAEAVLQQAFADGGDTLLVSAEDLCAVRADALARLRTLLGQSQVTIIFYVRRWSDLLPSAWQEMVKQGHSLSFPEFFAANLRNPESSQHFNWDLRLVPFAEVFGRENIRLVSYSALRDANVDLFGHFARHFLNWWNAPALPGTLEMNSSRPVEQIEVMRRLNMIEFARSGTRSAALRNRLDAAWLSIDKEFLLAAMQPSKQTMLFHDGFPMLRRMHLDIHERYRAQIVKPGPPDMFFRPVRQEIPYIAGDYLMQPGVVEALHSLYDRISPG